MLGADLKDQRAAKRADKARGSSATDKSDPDVDKDECKSQQDVEASNASGTEGAKREESAEKEDEMGDEEEAEEGEDGEDEMQEEEGEEELDEICSNAEKGDDIAARL